MPDTLTTTSAQQAPTGLPRFIPLSQMGSLGGTARYQPASSLGSLSPQSLFANFGNMSQPTSGTQSALQNVSRLGSGLGALGGASQFASHLAGGSPMLSSIGSGLGGASSVLGLAGPISSFFSPSRYGALQGALGIPGAIGGLSSLIPGVSGGMLSSLTAAPGTAAALGGSIGAAGAGMASGGLGAGLAAGGGGLAGLGSLLGAISGTLALPLAFASQGVSNMMKKDAKKTKQQTIESGDIRRGLVEAVPNVIKGMETARTLDQISALPPDQQIPALQQAYTTLQTAIQDLSVDFSRFISTGGMGGRNSLVGKVPTGDAEKLAAEAWPDVLVGMSRVQDALAQRGVPLNDINDRQRIGSIYDAAGLLNFGRQFGGVGGTDWALGATPQQLLSAAPGNMEQFLTSQFSSRNPDFANSVLGQRFAGLPGIAAPATLPANLQQAIAQYGADRQAVSRIENEGIRRGGNLEMGNYGYGGYYMTPDEKAAWDAETQRRIIQRSYGDAAPDAGAYGAGNMFGWSP